MNSNKLLIKLINHKAEHRLINIPDVSPSQPPDAAAFVIIIVFLTIVNVGVSCRLPVTSSIVSLQIERLLSPSSSPTLSSASPSRYQSIFSVESWYHSIFFRVSCRLCVVNAFGLLRPALAPPFLTKLFFLGDVVRDARGAPYRFISDRRQVRKNRL